MSNHQNDFRRFVTTHPGENLRWRSAITANRLSGDAGILIGHGVADHLSFYPTFPWFISRGDFDEHTLITGPAGSRKSSWLLMILDQLIDLQAMEIHNQSLSTDHLTSSISIHLFDFKNEPALYNGTRLAAERHPELSLQFLTLNPYLPTNLYSLLDTQNLPMSLLAQGDALVKGFGMDHGTSFEAGFISRLTLRVAIRMAALQAQSLRELAPYLQTKKSKQQKWANPGPSVAALGFESPVDTRYAIDLLASAEILSYPLVLNATPEMTESPPPDGLTKPIPKEAFEHAIRAEDALTTPLIRYFHLPSTEPQSSRAVAAFYLSKLMEAAAARQAAGLPNLTNYIIAPEGWRFPPYILQQLITLGREPGLKAIIACQDMTEFDPSIRDSVFGSTNQHISFGSAVFEEMKYISEMSGTTVDHTVSYQLGPDGITESYSETVVPRIDRNTLTRVTANKELGIIRKLWDHDRSSVKMGGFSHVFRWQPHISPDEYVNRLTATWGELAGEPGKIIAAEHEDPTAAPSFIPQPRLQQITPRPSEQQLQLDFEGRPETFNEDIQALLNEMYLGDAPF